MAMTGAMGSGISGMKAFMEALNVVGNNVANVNTYGYKAARVTFQESIYSTQSAGSGGTDLLGSTNPNQIGYGTSLGTIDLDMATQSMASTGRDLDCAIAGDGFFLLGNKAGLENAGPDSLTFSRVGNFKVDNEGYLTDGAGNIVYGFLATGPDEDDIGGVLTPIRLPAANADGETIYDEVADYEGDSITYRDFRIDANGQISCVNDMTGEPVVVGYIALGTVTNPAGLTHTSGPYYEIIASAGDISIFTPGSGVTGDKDAGDEEITLLEGNETTLMTGFLEDSGTDLATEFANMILYQRGYQANTRIVTVTDAMLEELINMKR